MTWLVFENSDDKTQLFISIILILFISFIILGNIYFWIKEKIKKK